MKKFTKRMTALLLMLVLLFSMTGCGKKVTEEDFYGTWKGTVSGDVLTKLATNEDSVKDAFAELEGFLKMEDLKFEDMPLILTFNEDKTFTIKIDEAWGKTAVKSMVDWMGTLDLEGFGRAMLEEQLKSTGMSVDDALKQLGYKDVSEALAAFGVTKEALIEEMSKELEKGFDSGDFLDMNSDGTWKFEEGKDYVQITVNGETENLALDQKAFTLTEKSAALDNQEIVFSKDK